MGTLRPVFVWALALIAVPMLLLFGIGFVTDVEGPWRIAMAPAYVVGAYVAPAIFVRRGVRQGVSGAKAVAAALGIGSLVLLLDLIVYAGAGDGALGSLLMTAVAGGALAWALKWHPHRLAIPPRAEGRVLLANPPGHQGEQRREFRERQAVLFVDASELGPRLAVALDRHGRGAHRVTPAPREIDLLLTLRTGECRPPLGHGLAVPAFGAGEECVLRCTREAHVVDGRVTHELGREAPRAGQVGQLFPYSAEGSGSLSTRARCSSR